MRWIFLNIKYIKVGAAGEASAHYDLGKTNSSQIYQPMSRQQVLKSGLKEVKINGYGINQYPLTTMNKIWNTYINVKTIRDSESG